ncbi:MAG TPA: glycoside hydrolase family 15 protein [Candidatus Binatia bacterium]|nr:glycoside hydrolase family 15 protein [Candidatus Binatia bacterium]
MATQRIQDYAIIGDCRSAALVSREGSIDWLCWPRFDSSSVFGALLDPQAGHWRIAPTAPFKTERRYVDETNVLETRFRTETGSLLLIDLMPVASEEEKRRHLLPEHEILRLVECEKGEVEVEILFDPRPRYAQRTVRARDAGKFGIRVETGYGLLTLQSSVPMTLLGDGRAHATARLRAGEALDFSLTFSVEWPAVLPPLGQRTRQAIARSVTWWERWASRLKYDGPGRAAVIRSALVLRLLFYAPSGAIVAAPTTSLPERVGGDLNWDYRYCWLRDAALTVRALFGLGCTEEAEAFVSWLIHSTRLTRPELRILYDIYGNAPERERTLDHLAGYRSSRPVRIGNAAFGQLQLDVYGEVIDAVTHFVCTDGTLDRETRNMLCAFGDYVCRNWQKPDEGIWEPRSGRYNNTHSRVLCWTALDRLLELHAHGHLPEAPVSDFQKNRDAIRREVEERAWNPRLESYAARLDTDELDASLLLLPWYGFDKASSYRVRQTYARIRERLGAGAGLLYRYRTGESPGEGAFGICSFWGAEYLALGGGTAAEAQEVFERLIGYANDLGLFAEEIDPETGDALGNFPQAFTHVGLINAALSLAKRLKGEKPLERPIPAKSPAPMPQARV